MNELAEVGPLPRHPDRSIVLAEVAGFCFGVRRALRMAEDARASTNGQVTMLGPIVHNDQVVNRLERQGVGTADRLDRIAAGTVLLSAHGSPPGLAERVRGTGLRMVDATCPFVTRVHRSACMLHEQGYQVVLLGDAGHTEVRGVVGAVEAAGGTVTVLPSPEAARSVPLGKKVGVISQTTQRADDFAAIVGILSRRAQEVRAINTICGATDELQEAALKMAAHADVAIVIGGARSANTERLRQLCAEAGIPAYRIETPEEIDERWLEGKSRIGVTAGASTPDWIIEAVARHLNGGELPSDWRLHHPDEK